MRNVYLLHGCCQRTREYVQSERNFVSVDTLWEYLKSRPEKFGPLGAAGSHDVLTVDDATYGAAQACTLAREAGHSVTVFVNPYQIETQCEYWFTQFDAVLDVAIARRATYRDRQYTMESPKEVRDFRLSVKTELMHLSPDDADYALNEIASALGVHEFEVPEHGRVLPVSELGHLQSLGVSLENHGWDHREIAVSKLSDVAREIERAQDWILLRVGSTAGHFAVPYGLTRLDERIHGQVDGLVLLADPRRELGDIGGRHWNRLDITGRLRRGVR